MIDPLLLMILGAGCCRDTFQSPVSMLICCMLLMNSTYTAVFRKQKHTEACIALA